MYGLEKNEMEKFQFDVEKEIKTHPKKGQEYKLHLESAHNEIRTLLREGQKGTDLKTLELLANGYEAASKVVNRVLQK